MDLKPASQECPRAVALLNGMPRESILTWLKEYHSGRAGLRALEQVPSALEPYGSVRLYLL